MARDHADADRPLVLVAEDEEGLRSLMEMLLRRAGFDVLQAGTGRAALDVVLERGADIDAVLLDVMMPDSNGDEVLPAMRRACPGLPVVFTSGFDQREVADHLDDPEAYTSFMPKPFDNAELVEELHRAVDSR